MRPRSEANMVNDRAVQDDVLAVGRSGAIDTILRVLSQATGMRIALVARVTEESWTACAILDEAGLGIKPGDVLPLHTTF
ncbi:MAG: hypothetical protein NVSMB52_18800 [Chloroflexota bacterium]